MHTAKHFDHVGIREETNKLHSAVVSGPLGAETVLAKLYPQEISLFGNNIDTLAASVELEMFHYTLAINGVNTLFFRDKLAEILVKDKKMAKLVTKKIESKLIDKAKKIHEKYKPKGQDLEQVIHEVNKFYKRDVDAYGEPGAAAVNYKLSLENKIPLGNIIFSRDQANVVLGARIISNMKKDIRKPEVDLYNLVYDDSLSPHRTISLPASQTVEGGDIFVHDKVIYIGIGPRTSESAAKTIFKKMMPLIREYKYEFAVVGSWHAPKREKNDEMNFMHLDSWAMPLGKNQMLVFEGEAVYRTVELYQEKNGRMVIHDTGLNFIEFVQSRDQRVYYVPKGEQANLGCNILSVNEDTIVIPNLLNKGTLGQLKKAGKTIIPAPLNEISKGFGAVHCLVAPVERSRA